MYRISELAALTGLSRTALLYYEKLGLVTGQRANNGYRQYSQADLQRVRLLQQLQAGGLSLAECKSCLDERLDSKLLRQRLASLDAEIAQKQQARELLAGLLGEHSLRDWHQQADLLAPEAHFQWLLRQGFDEKQALRLKWLSKDMHQHDDYMADFMAVYSELNYWAPGCEKDSLQALEKLPTDISSVLDIGCGKGLATLLLAQHTKAQITALDNEPSALEALQQRAKQRGFSQRITGCCASMTELPFNPASFELIWAEGSAYIMGIEAALSHWRSVLVPRGYLVLSDLVWLTDSPSEPARQFWHSNYPDMQSVPSRLQQIAAAGYRVINHFSQSHSAWDNYYLPLATRVAELRPQLPQSSALDDIEREIAIYRQHLGEFGYQLFVLQLSSD